ncbi:hypothetical protein QQS21_010137 [Conoideocrella luteorostrata]|uniref:DUF7729 domain-containing protein n=1 Tax=Conoideocrella luteorostrata TaxID=1105319 RepID=A0AAJ0CIC3_9HYPO|nr:hypothetical protein QQS21_010137 [Conoideocrella luteorostrata]
MALLPSTWPSMLSTACPPPIPASGVATTERKPARRKSRMPPRLTLPLTILAVAATLGQPVLGEKDALAPKITTPASLDQATFSSSLDEVQTVIATAVPMPATNEVPELRLRRSVTRVKRMPKERNNLDGNDFSTTAKALAMRSTATSDGASSPLPSPFDSPVPSAFQIPGGGNSCPKYMSTLLSDPTFKSCYPISMLIQTSTGFFNAEKQLVSIVKVLEATCAADVTKCTDFLSTAARNLTSDGNCKAEFEQNQTQVLQAYRGLRAYKVLYSAACLQTPDTNTYCFANAVTNLSTPSDTYLYFMPYGLALPGASRPTCNWCTKQTMAIYNSAAADRRQPVASRYEDAARQVNTLCGPNFVNSSLPASASGAFTVTGPSYLSTVANALFVIVIFACFL